MSDDRFPVSPRSRAGFTLIEILVVTGIISVLIGILIPVVGKARQQARMAVELSASRQLILAYLGYSTDNRGWLIPGHIANDPSIKAIDDMGVAIAGEPIKRWPWRLTEYIKFQIYGSILVNERAATLADRNAFWWHYMVSLTPSLGLNYYGLGGDFNAATGTVYPSHCLKKLTQVYRSSQMIVFVSARGPGMDGMVDGYFKVVPPTQSFEYSASGWTNETYRTNDEPAAWGYVHPRWNHRAVVAHLDGHSELLSMDQLRDMTRWSDPAARSGDPNWRP